VTRFQTFSGFRGVRRFEGIARSVVVALLGVALPAGLASGANEALRLDATPQVAQWMGEQRSAYPAPGGVLHMAVQLSGPVDAQTSARLRAAGIRLMSTLAPGRYLAAVDLAGSTAHMLQTGAPLTLEGVSSIEPVAPGLKLSPDLRMNSPYSWATREVGGATLVEFNLKYADSANAAAAEALVMNAGGTIVGRAPQFNRIRGQAPVEKMLSLALPHWVVAVQSVDPPPAATDTNSNQISAQMMNVDQVQAAPYSLTGQGVNVMELDEGQIDLHPELQGRVFEIDTAYPPSAHSTHVAGTIAAAGLDPRLKGMAPGAQLYSYSFQVDGSASRYLDAISNYGADLSNNSWADYLSEYLTSSECNWIGSYGTSESDIDQVVNQNRFTIVFAMGNDRSKNLCSLQQQGGFYSTGKPAAAKNTIAVAAVDGSKAVSYFSNYGPTADGRLKPDISALGSNVLSLDLNGGSVIMSGTSMATPAITGTLALLIERYHSQHADSPSPALLKSILLNTAIDLGNPGPDYTYGYGIPDAVEAVSTIDQGRFTADSANAGDTKTYTVTVPGSAAALRVMLAYSDVEGVPGSSAALVNDLDLTVSSPTGQVTLPLTLDPLQPTAAAVPGKNGRDPVEQVVIQNPAAGAWTVTITGTSVPVGPQEFALSWSFASVALQPPCSRTAAVSPGGLPVGATGGAQTLAITQSSGCAPLRATYPDSWVQGTTEAIQGTTAIKLNVDPNTASSQRISTLQFSDGGTNVLTVPVVQAAPCFAGPVTPGTPLNDALSSNDCVSSYGTYQRSYTFNGQAGQALAASLNSNDFDQVLVLELPDGTQILESDDIDDATVRIPQGNRGFILPFDGQYTLLVTSYFTGETGAFTLDVEFPDPATLDSVVKWNFVTACPASVGGTLGSGSDHDGHRGALFPVDSYIVYGHLGDTIAATVAGASFDPVLYLMPLAMENILATADNALPGKPASISYTILTPGFYSVQITPYLFGQSGNYTLSLGGCRSPSFVTGAISGDRPPRWR
jgi:subtilisin family serine protease